MMESRRSGEIFQALGIFEISLISGTIALREGTGFMELRGMVFKSFHTRYIVKWFL